MVGKEGNVNESIIVGLVVGAGVAVIGALIGHFLRLREMDQQWDREKQRMEALWAEEERRRKSDRRRELYEGELRIVSDAVAGLARTTLSVTCPWGETVVSRVESLKEVALMIARARLMTLSLDDLELMQRYAKLLEIFQDWSGLFDLETGEAKEGKEEDLGELTDEAEVAASKVLQRIREILEKV